MERIAGPHCYAFYAGEADFDAMMEAEPGTFFLTDFLARHFERLVIEGLGLDRFPQLRDDYFGHYTRLVYLAQTDDPALDAKARGRRAPARARATSAASPGSAARGFARNSRKAPGRMANLIILYWRDIPSQVIAKAGRKTAKRELARALHQGDRRGRDARGRRSTRRLSRRLAARRAGPAATISKPRPTRRRRGWSGVRRRAVGGAREAKAGREG